VTTPTRQPGEQRPRLDHPPSDRYQPRAAPAPSDDRTGRIVGPLAVVLGGAIGFVLLGGLMAVTSGLLVLAAVQGWLLGRLVSPPWRAGLVGLAAVTIGLLGIWLFGRIEGGVLDPLTYLAEVHGWALIGFVLLAGGGLAAAASR